MKKVYEGIFNYKINQFSDHPKFDRLRHSADEALKYHTGYGLDAIHAADFIDRIVKMPLDYIGEWLDGENALQWINSKTGEDYDKEHLADALNRQLCYLK